ncbi:MAG: hypothetical protein IKA99_07075 [Clostridia bacterium]|nr:hypothetical protein [Clostridia bacterium]
MKKLILILLTMVVCFALTGCSCSKNKTEPSSSPIGSEHDVGGEYPEEWN